MQRVPLYTAKEEQRLAEIVAEVDAAMPEDFKGLSALDIMPRMIVRNADDIYSQLLAEAEERGMFVDQETKEQIAVESICYDDLEKQQAAWLGFCYRDRESFLPIPFSVLTVAELLLTAEAGGWSYERESPNPDFDKAIADYALDQRRDLVDQNTIGRQAIKVVTGSNEANTAFYEFNPLYHLTREETGEEAHLGLQIKTRGDNRDLFHVFLVRGNGLSVSFDPDFVFDIQTKSSYRVNFKNELYST